MKGSGLSRHLIILMIQLVCSSLLITFITYYAWVGLAVMVFGEQAKQFEYVATTSDWVQLGVSAGLSIIVAVITAVRFAKRFSIHCNPWPIAHDASPVVNSVPEPMPGIADSRKPLPWSMISTSWLKNLRWLLVKS